MSFPQSLQGTPLTEDQDSLNHI
ncbi:hypothetical protein OF001_U20095 [Pseudomonas sp. OF001]|nr:hypothetical protein OF001_U20095 [Pseudomonas sp. OF001]